MVNVNDVDAPEEIPKNILKAIFEKQFALAIKYREIEKMPELLLRDPKDNIDTAEGQRWIKDFAWRVTEEICEALEAKNAAYEKVKAEIHKKEGMDKLNAYQTQERDVKETEEFYHYLEEVTDALHFMTELCIIAGYTWEDFDVPVNYNAREMDCVYQLGLAMNCLKNKPWKQTQMLTDRPKFKKYLQKAYARLIGIYFTAGYNMDKVYVLYFKKNAVNQFRQRSKY